MGTTKPADFLAAAKSQMPQREVSVAGMDVVVCGLSVRQIEQANEYAKKPSKRNHIEEVDGEKLTARLLSLSLFDKSGAQLIPQDREDEIFDMPNDIVKTLGNIVFEINGMRSPADGEEKND